MWSTEARIIVAALLAAACAGCGVVGLPWDNVRGCVARTPPPAAQSAATVDVVALGDIGALEDGRNTDVAEALRAYLQDRGTAPAAVLLLGDNFYPFGLIGSDEWCLPGAGLADDASIRAQLTEVVSPLAFLRERTVTYALPGNHDYACTHRGSLDNQGEIDRWLAPREAWGAHWQAFQGLPEAVVDSPQLLVVAIDTTRMIRDADFLDASARRLEEILGASPARWRAVAGHHPLYANGHHDGAWLSGTALKLFYYPSHLLLFPPVLYGGEASYEWIYRRYRRRLEEVFSRQRVDLVLGGHEHALELLDRSGAGQPLTVVSGAAAKCAKVMVRENTIFAASKNGFAVVSASPDSLALSLVATSGCDRTDRCPRPKKPGEWHELYRHVLR